MKKILPLRLLVSVVAARAVSVVGDFTLTPDYSTTEAASVVAGNLRLVPGTYTARVTGVGEVLVEVYFVD